MTQRVAIIGGGKIGEALLAGLIASGRATKDLVVAERASSRAQELKDEYGIRVTDVADAVEGAAIVVLAIKPADVDAVLELVSGVEDAGETERLTVTLVAGLPTRKYESALPAGAPVVRVMPNTPMLVNEAMSAVAGGRYATEKHVATVVGLLESVGKVVVVPEKQMDAVTALSGSGPAYAFLMAEAMIDAGVGLGLSRPVATELAGQTIRGAGVLLTDSGLSPVDLRAAVTSPAGTTAEAIRQLEANGFRHGFYEAMRANVAASVATAAAQAATGGTEPSDRD
ncbi:pyrroline-5-carboxylate reductase [Williamsia phyllosphaerae]|uniref:Pyrroline-5-carboxylate reductase n=1 Tax=Williamsia phyllosphaerae TaxID=885042 RepID=A0ABQ1UQ02_9NOCA|nr:pyrroline-5-carboxylate reductase [Williamsia phyllosphaerae]GGF22286.1 pyrroline-5-carboxylate reductase [Williamsia phyllosphaerae]